MGHRELSLTALIELLNQGEPLTQQDIAKHFGVHSRTVSRAVQQLQKRYVIRQVRMRRQKAYVIPEEHRRHRIRLVELSEQQMVALAVAARATTATLRSTPLHHPLRSAFDLLLEALNDPATSVDLRGEPDYWHFNEAPVVEMSPDVISTLRKGMIESCSTEIDYVSTSTGRHWRKVDPYCFAFRDGSWLLVAWCHERHDTRAFAIADVIDARLCDPASDAGAIFHRPDDFDSEAFFKDTFYAVTGDPTVVRLLVTPDHARAFRRKQYHPTQQTERENADGSIVVSFETSGILEVASFVLGWGAGVRVLEPAELIDEIRSVTQSVALQYNDA